MVLSNIFGYPLFLLKIQSVISLLELLFANIGFILLGVELMPKLSVDT